MIDTIEVCNEIRRSTAWLSKLRVHPGDEFLRSEHLKKITEQTAILEQQAEKNRRNSRKPKLQLVEVVE